MEPNKTQSQFVVSAKLSKPGEVLVSWDNSVYESAIIRDPDTGNILTINESGKIKVYSNADRLELTLTSGFVQTVSFVDVEP